MSTLGTQRLEMQWYGMIHPQTWIKNRMIDQSMSFFQFQHEWERAKWDESIWLQSSPLRIQPRIATSAILCTHCACATPCASVISLGVPDACTTDPPLAEGAKPRIPSKGRMRKGYSVLGGSCDHHSSPFFNPCGWNFWRGCGWKMDHEIFYMSHYHW